MEKVINFFPKHKVFEVVSVFLIILILVKFSDGISPYSGRSGDQRFWQDFKAWSLKYADQDENSIVSRIEFETFRSKFLKKYDLLMVDGGSQIYDREGKAVLFHKVSDLMKSYDSAHHIYCYDEDCA